MAVNFTNNFTNILNKLRNTLRTEFKGTLPVYIGHEQKEQGNQYLRLDPVGSTLSEYNVNGEIREFQVNMFYYFSDPNLNKTSLDHVLRFVSRIEALIHDNITMDLDDTPTTQCFNCRIESTELNALDDENEYVVQFEWRGQHHSNTA
jgi:hypothetical protein|tara:strand:- start:230 stop:673 length:444 start_codon:yes stop_codon:yes gene_type:complete